MKKLLILLCFTLTLNAIFPMQANAQTKAPVQNKPLKASDVTAEQIRAFQMMFDMMPPEQKDLLSEEIRKQAATITPKQKEAVIQRAKLHYDTLTPQEKAAMRVRLLQLSSKLTPEQRAEFLDRLEK